MLVDEGANPLPLLLLVPLPPSLSTGKVVQVLEDDVKHGAKAPERFRDARS